MINPTASVKNYKEMSDRMDTNATPTATWPTDEFGHEIDPALLNVDTTHDTIAMFVKVNGTWRFEGFMGEAHSVISQPVAEFKEMVESENGPGTAFVVKLPS